jgi:hypothetical protein
MSYLHTLLEYKNRGTCALKCAAKAGAERVYAIHLQELMRVAPQEIRDRLGGGFLRTFIRCFLSGILTPSGNGLAEEGAFHVSPVC